jgi:NH3-dependent NAD+ synthetase
MGTRDYVAKCGFSKVVVGLSGGIDSALVTASPSKRWAAPMY